MNYFAHPLLFWLFGLGLLLVVAEGFLRRRFHFVLLIRAAWILLLAFILADLTHLIPKELSQPELVRVFIDQSDSVQRIPERKERVQKFVSEMKEWSAAKQQPIEFLGFGDGVRPWDEKFEAFPSTRIFPLEEYLEKAKTDGGINVIVSDGIWSDRANIAQRSYAVQIGDSDSEKDLWFEDVQPVFTAFLKNRLKIPISIGQHGFKGERAKVQLVDGEEVLDEKEVALGAEPTRIELGFFPEKMGEKVLTLKLSTLSGEISEINNQIPIKVRTVRDKIRILHIGGKPSFDLKTWRLFLTRQPDVDLVSFYILRSLNDDPEAKNTELSLIPFPYEELFSTELEKFDLVILHNFDFNLYFQPFFLTNLARFVREGGALLMVGGDQSFHRYEGSPLESLLPFRYAGPADFREKDLKAEVVHKHPVIDGLEFAFPRIQWTGAHSVLEESRATTAIRYAGTNYPLLSFWQHDKGRVLAINSDESWKLQMQPGLSEVVPFPRLARRILQYLTFDPEMEPHRILTGPWHVGKNIQLATEDRAQADWVVHPLWVSRALSDKKETGPSIHYDVQEPGVYEVRASTTNEKLIVMTEEEPWHVEWKHLISNDGNLKNLIAQSGGRFFQYSDRAKLFQEDLSGRQIISAEIHSFLHDATLTAWGLLILLLSLMSLDFFFRKRAQWDR